MIFARRKLVRVHLDGKEFSLEGVLVERTPAHYVLANAFHLEPPEARIQLDGRVLVPRERVLYLQEIG